MNGRNISEGKL